MMRVAITLLVLLLVPSVALAEKRIALLIGNKDYKAGVGALVNPLNDVRVVADALRAVGFEVLTPVQNARRADMLLAVHDFSTRLKAAGPDAVGFLYYSGHGIASAGENYLIPVDVDEPSTRLLSVQGVKQSEVLAILRSEAPNAAHYLVLDACRNALQGARGGKGFIPVGQQSGVLVALAAEPGKTASDTGQRSGPYAAALAEELVRPGQSDLIMFHRVRVAVMEKTGGDQVPWTEDGIQRRDRVLFGGETKSALQSLASEAERAWTWVKDTSNQAVLENFIKQFRDTKYGAMARLRLEELKKQQVAVATPPKAPTVPPEAEPPKFGGPCGSTATVAGGVAALVGSEHRCLKPKDIFKDCPDCPEMVVVPAGEFMMGSESVWAPAAGGIGAHTSDSEKPVHKVTIARAFAVGKFEVTFAEWEACMAAGGCKHRPGDQGWGKGNRPVIEVSWDDITKEYLPWLSRKSGRTYRLLSEAEWEYAARAGSPRKYAWGDEVGRNLANCNGCGSQWDNKQTAPAGSFKANAFGLHDLHGNVWEWVEDCYQDNYNGAPTDGSAISSASCSSRVLRGGSWLVDPQALRSAFRFWVQPVVRIILGGFRVARTL